MKHRFIFARQTPCSGRTGLGQLSFGGQKIVRPDIGFYLCPSVNVRVIYLNLFSLILKGFTRVFRKLFGITFSKIIALGCFVCKAFAADFPYVTRSAPFTPADEKDALNRILARPLLGFLRQKIGIAPFFQVGITRQISNSLIFNVPVLAMLIAGDYFLEIPDRECRSVSIFCFRFAA